RLDPTRYLLCSAMPASRRVENIMDQSVSNDMREYRSKRSGSSNDFFCGEHPDGKNEARWQAAKACHRARNPRRASCAAAIAHPLRRFSFVAFDRFQPLETPLRLQQALELAFIFDAIRFLQVIVLKVLRAARPGFIENERIGILRRTMKVGV